jgi:hypothetical protein
MPLPILLAEHERASTASAPCLGDDGDHTAVETVRVLLVARRAGLSFPPRCAVNV